VTAEAARKYANTGSEYRIPPRELIPNVSYRRAAVVVTKRASLEERVYECTMQYGNTIGRRDARTRRTRSNIYFNLRMSGKGRRRDFRARGRFIAHRGERPFLLSAFSRSRSRR